MSMLRMPSVKEITGHKSHASIYNAINRGLFTKPVQIGQRAVGWPSYEVEAINAARIAGKSEAAIRGLVVDLHARRIDTFTCHLPSGLAIHASFADSNADAKVMRV